MSYTFNQQIPTDELVDLIDYCQSVVKKKWRKFHHLDEIVENVTVLVFDGIERYRPEQTASIKTFIVTYVNNRTIDYVRLHLLTRDGAPRPNTARDVIDKTTGDSVLDLVVGQDADPESSYAVVRLLAELARLDDREREVLKRHDMDGQTLSEIGIILGITKARVDQIGRAARCLLRSRYCRRPARRCSVVR